MNIYCAFVLCGLVISSVQLQELFPLSIIHINDFHARFEEVDKKTSVTCKPEVGQTCIGGYARTVTAIKQLKAKRENSIYLNAGDNFQGTLWYNIHRWNVTSHFLNLLPADAMTIGNHEFDNGVEGVVPFLNSINSPVLLSNVDSSEEPTFTKYQKSMILERSGRKIGVIGTILSTTDNIANTGKLKFFEESAIITDEAEKLKSQGVNIIIVLSHCGLDVDKIIAQNAGPNIDIIVGGHSHTFLYTGDHPNIPGVAQGEYPTIITQNDGHKVLIVQAASYTKFVGDIILYFDENGIIQKYEGNPVYLDSSIIPDPEIEMELLPWKVEVDQQGKRVVGSTRVDLKKNTCYDGECNIGSLVTDAYVSSFTKLYDGKSEWTHASIALSNVGGIRTDLLRGNLTYGDLITVLPFENTLNIVELRADYLLAALEHSVSKSSSDDRFSSLNMLQVSGLKIVYNVTRPPFERVVSVQVLCRECNVPKYVPLNVFEYYRVILPSFLSGGGDGFYVFQDHARLLHIGDIDINAFSDYIEMMSPVSQGIDGRIKLYK